MNKKAAEKIISVYWFVILFIVAGAVVYMVFAFYGQPYNVRDIEERLLSDRVADCLSQGGYINPNFLSDEGFRNNLLENCDLTFETEDQYEWNEKQQYYLGIRFYRFDEGKEDLLGTELLNIEKGNLNLKLFSEPDKGLLESVGDFLTREEKNESVFSKERSLYVLDKSNNQYVIKILALVRKTEKNEQ